MAATVGLQSPRAEVVVDEAGTPSRLRFSSLSDITLAMLRVASGLMLIQHGVQKHFGLLTPADQPFTAPEPFSVMSIAGTLEIGGGLLLAIGLFTRLVGFVLSGFMATAYFTVHAPQGFWPILNQGELAALYCFVFLTFAAIGGGPYSVDGLIARRRGLRSEPKYTQLPKRRWRRPPRVPGLTAP